MMCRRAGMVPSWRERLRPDGRLSGSEAVLGKTKLIGFIVTIVFLALVLWRTDLNGVVAAFQSANYLYVVPAFVCVLTGYAARTARWRRILIPTKVVPFADLFPVLMMGFMANNLLPARIGEFVRAHLLGRKEDISRSLAFATVMLERLFDGVALLVFLGAVALVLPLPGWGSDLGFFAGGVFLVAGLGVLAVLQWEELARAIIRLALRPLPLPLASTVASKIDLFILGFRALRAPWGLIAIFGLSMVVWALETIAILLVLVGFNLPLSPLVILTAGVLMLVVVNLGIMLPSAPGFIGTYQFFAILALGVFGVQREVALSIAIITHGVQYVLVTGLGLVFLSRENLSWRRLGEVGSER